MNNYISLCNVRIDNFLVPFVYPALRLKTYWASLQALLSTCKQSLSTEATQKLH